MTRRSLCATVLALCLAGCGGDEPLKLDTAPIEKGIATGVEKDRPGTKVVSVTCPDDVELRKGGTFSCRVKGSKPGEDAIATVTQTDDNGRVRYSVP